MKILSFPIACFQIVLDVLCADFFYCDKGLVAREWGTRFDAHAVTKVIFVLRVVDLITFEIGRASCRERV